MNNQFVAIKINEAIGGWVATDSKDNAIATATKAAATGKTHIITGAFASFSATKSGLLQVKDGNTVIAEQYIYDSGYIPLNVKATAGNAVSAVLTASGTATTLGKVNLTGFTV